MAHPADESTNSLSVIEHLVLFKFKDGYTEEQELNMYKGLWSFEDYYPTIVTMSLGRVLKENAENVTHALVMRFASKETLDAYMADDYRIEVSYKTIVPFFNGELTCDYEANIGVDLSQLYKDSEAYEDGIEHVEFFKTKEGTPDTAISELLTALTDLPKKVQTKIVQVTAGISFTSAQKYNLAAAMRLPSANSLASLLEEPAYKDFLKSNQAILDDHLVVDFRTNESKAKIEHLEPSLTKPDA